MRTWTIILMICMIVLGQFFPALGKDTDHPNDMTFLSRSGTCYVKEDTASVRIGNDLLELQFEKGSKGGLDKIIDRKTGIDLRGDKAVPPTLFALFYHTGAGMDAAIQWDALSVTFENSSTSMGSTLFINFTRIKGYDINISVMVRVEETSSLARMRMDIENDEGFVLKYVFFPLVWGMGKIGSGPEDDVLLFPTGDGLTIRDPLSVLGSLYLSDMYPAGASMQFMCHYDPDEAGLYLATYDTLGTPKKLNMVSLDWDSSKRLASFFQLFVPEHPGNDLVMDYDAILGTFHGDWYDAAEIYSQWAHTTPFVSGGKVGIDKDTPPWWYNTSVVSAPNRDRGTVHNTLPSIVNMTQDMSSITGLDTTALIFAWEHEGGWVGPNFFPPAEGEDDFIKAMEDLDSTGDHGFVYLSGTVWRITREDIGYSNWSYFNSTGRPFAALTETGEVLMDENYLAIGWQCARMCPYTKFWHDLVVDNVMECIRLGVDVVQIDEFPIGTMYPCYNASHGHPVGYSREMSAAYISLLEDIRTRGRLNEPDLILSTEEPCELYVPYLDTYVSRDNAEEYMLYPFIKQMYVDQIQFVPAFGQVYHEYITSFGEPIYLGKSYPEFFNDQIKRGLARSLVQGEVMAAGGAGKGDMWPELLELYERTSRASATYANEYVVMGKPLRPPVLDVPKKKVEWYFGSIGKFGNPFNESVVVNGAWKAPDGVIGHILVNWDDTAHSFGLELWPYDLGPGNWSVVRTTNGKRELLYRSVALPTTVLMDMGPNDVVLVEVTRAPDIVITGIEIMNGLAVVTNETIDVMVRLENHGTLATDDLEVRLDLLGVGQIGTMMLSSVPITDYVTVPFEWNTSGLIGTFDLKASADPKNDVWELLEDNNIFIRHVEVLERPRSTITVRVIDNRTSISISECQVTLKRTDTFSLSTTNITNSTGECAFYSLHSGPYNLGFNVDGYRNRSMDLFLPEGTIRSVSIALDPSYELFDLTGTVMDNSTGKPLEGALVTFLVVGTDLDHLGPYIPVMTDATGHFTFRGVPEGDCRLSAEKAGYHDAIMNFYFERDMVGLDIMVVMDPIVVPVGKGDVKCIVRDIYTNEVLRDVLVRMTPFSRTYTTNAAGECIFLEVPEGLQTLNLTARSYYPFETVITVIAGSTVHCNLTMTPLVGPPIVLGRIIGKVVDTEGGPIIGASVRDNRDQVVATSGPLGEFIISDLEPGTYYYTVYAEGFFPKGTGYIDVYRTDVSVTITLIPIPQDPNDDDGSGFLFLFLGGAIVIIFLLAVISLSFIYHKKVKGKADSEQNDWGIEE